jgi:microcystin-dependent protein
LRAGRIAIASQAAGDALFAASATQLGRLAAVGGCTLNYTGAAWEMANAVSTAAWPVGSIYESVLATNPATLLGVGTWTAHGAGRVTVAIDASQTEFDTVDETGGAKTVTLVTAELPIHNHSQDPHTHTQTSHTHTQDAHSHSLSNIGNTIDAEGHATAPDRVLDNTGSASTNTVVATNQAATATNQNATATNQNTGGGVAHTNIQPYVIFYRWRRTA